MPQSDLAKQDIKLKDRLETICSCSETFTFEDREEHTFNLILSYSLSKEFLDELDLKQKIAEFHNHVLQPEQHTLNFEVHQVRVGCSTEYYLIGFMGKVSGECLEVKATEIVALLTTLLEAFFICVSPGEFNPLQFELDGQIIIKPTPDTEGIPQEYDGQSDLTDFIIWNLDYVVGDLIYFVGEVVAEGSAEVAGEVISGVAESGGELLEGASEVVGELAVAAVEFLGELILGIIQGIFEGILGG